ncbi:uncharacterized protein UMAG_04354 [Mycosarcoma maydis]|uniref:Acyltransferase 3 domain-containing protein n=1 Tax=Mycosarcoma maydis TaxID=5270 RepID=A0A0D1DXL6_MYCMD|nr:uncharacterized protein UMAG_04354 [Ustilago maydis 521]KIS67250.1 hypothetical protein UMAG_04354 [Ustilago maydis 521]|eukprot:XP_011391063.1 hypothetical protein UMAG_04354 [Ustilago maydis 521]
MVILTKTAPARLIASVLVLTASCLPLAQAACECGYRDPLTNALWTDRAITYFNETGLTDVVTQPSQSPRIYGGASPGETGDGQQTWSLVGNLVNKWENSFLATYRSAVSYNNTFADDNALALQVSPAEHVHRIVNGSQIVTRRRDILYGSFRAQIEPAISRGAGAAFKFSAAYNDSETVNIGIFTSNDPRNSTLQWSWSAYGHGDQPVKVNISSLGSTDYLEHRFDWQPELLQWRNAATNDSANFHSIQKGVNATHLPKTPAPISFQAWANGERSQSQGPPRREPLLTHVRYTRFFFNSSLEVRQSQFSSQCSIAAANADAICSTEDLTLRDSTPFDLAALNKFKPSKVPFTSPLYGVIAISVAVGIFFMTIAHGLVVRSIKAKDKKRAAAIAAQEKVRGSISASSSETHIDGFGLPPKMASLASHDSGLGSDGHVTPVDADKIEDKAQLSGFSSVATPATLSPAHATAAQPVHLWTAPDLVYGSDSDSDDGSDSDNDLSDARSYNSHTEFGARNQGVLPRFAGSTSSLSRPSNSLNGHDLPAFGGSGAETPRWIEDMKRTQTLPYVAPGFVGETASSAYSHSLSGHNKERPSYATSLKSDYDEIELVDSPYLATFSRQASSSHLGFPGADSSQDHSTHMTHDQLIAHRPRAGSFASMRSAAAASSMFDFQHEGTSRAGSIHEVYGSETHDAFQRPQIIQWQQRDLNAADGQIGALAKPELGDTVGRKARDGAGTSVKLPESFWQSMIRRINNLLFIKGTTQLTSTGARRIDYLDGMRGFACFLVSFHHFMLIYYYGITTPNAPHHYPKFEFWFRSLIGPIVVNQGLKLGIFFMLPSRTMTNRYLLKGGLQSMADATVRRVPRLALPVLGAVLANYFLMDVGAFKWVPRLASRTWSTWSYWQNFDNVMVFLNAFISLWWSAPPIQPAIETRYATGVLWTIPVIVQGTWTCLICALIAHEIKNAYKRFTFYGLCIALSWYANTWDLFFMAGLVVADLDSKLNYQAKAAKGIPLIPGIVRRGLHLPESLDKLRVHGQVLAWALFLACWVQQYLSQIPGAPGNGFDDREHRIHPGWSTEQPHAWTNDPGISYTSPRAATWLLSFSFFILTDLSNLLRAFFRLRVWSYIGKHAFAVFLMHGVIWWTWSAWLCLTMLAAGVPYWATILVVFFTSYALLMVVAECFTATFDSWGGVFSKAVWRSTSAGLGRKV